MSREKGSTLNVLAALQALTDFMNGSVRSTSKTDQTIHVCDAEGVRLEYAPPVWSNRMGLSGRCDVVEFNPDGRF